MQLSVVQSQAELFLQWNSGVQPHDPQLGSASHSFEYHEIRQHWSYSAACQMPAKTNIAWRYCTKY